MFSPLRMSPSGPPCTFSPGWSGNDTCISLLMPALPVTVLGEKMHVQLVSSVLQLQWGETNSQATLGIRVLYKCPLRWIPWPRCLLWAEAAPRSSCSRSKATRKSDGEQRRRRRYPGRQAGTTLDLISLQRGKHLLWLRWKKKMRADGWPLRWIKHIS